MLALNEAKKILCMFDPPKTADDSGMRDGERAALVLDAVYNYAEAIESADVRNIARAASRLEADRVINGVWKLIGGTIQMGISLSLEQWLDDDRRKRGTSLKQVMLEQTARTLALGVGGPLMLEKLFQQG